MKPPDLNLQQLNVTYNSISDIENSLHRKAINLSQLPGYTSMRLVITLFLCSSLVWVSSPASAQNKSQPDNLIPLPEAPEPPAPTEEKSSLPPELELDPSLEPEITIREGKDEMIEEYRVNGELYMIKITPRIGKPYYLVNRRRATGMTHPGDMGSGISVPMWEIYRF